MTRSAKLRPLPARFGITGSVADRRRGDEDASPAEPRTQAVHLGSFKLRIDRGPKHVTGVPVDALPCGGGDALELLDQFGVES